MFNKERAFKEFGKLVFGYQITYRYFCSAKFSLIEI